MSILPFLHFFTALVYLYLLVYVLVKNPKGLINRAFALNMLFFVQWAVSLMVNHHPAASKQTSILIVDICAVGWIGFSSAYLWFILEFTGKKEILKKKWLYLLMIGIPLVFVFKQWQGGVIVDMSSQYYGWQGMFAKSPWTYLFYAYYLSFVGAGLFINRVFVKETSNPVLKKQGKIMFVSIVIALVLGSVSDAFLPLLDIHVIPNLGITFALVWAFGVVYAMAKYKFLAITPATAAENIIATMFDCLILLDMAGNVVTANQATLDVSGYTGNELKGKSVDILLKEETGELNSHPDGSLTMIDSILEVGETNRELRLKTKTGKEIPVLFSSSLLKDESGSVTGLVCIAKDISERKKLAEETLKTQKLESVGILAGGMGHEFNNHLAVIVGKIDLAKHDLPPGSNACQMLENAERASDMAAELVGKFISFSRGRGIKKEQINIVKLLEKLDFPGSHGNNNRPDDFPQISYDLDFPDDLLPVRGDEVQLHHLVQNLLFNAAEAIPRNRDGHIKVLTENNYIGGNDPLPLESGSYVKVTVEDNGTGIPPDLIDKVFDPYFSTKKLYTQKGMGLGLTICYFIIKKHRGHITIQSEEGRGTTVTIYLPAHNE
ncbi:MAG: PAS domain S-box protein [bacterium]|nr:PAS domain S-box protein [bacterium]